MAMPLTSLPILTRRPARRLFPLPLAGSNHSFSFDHVFGPTTVQSDVFEEVSHFVQSALDGYNVCLFAYGQTGSGKTHTLTGALEGDGRGIIPRCVPSAVLWCACRAGPTLCVSLSRLDTERKTGWPRAQKLTTACTYTHMHARPRSAEKIVDTGIRMSEHGWVYSFKASYFEIYNETIRDLLAPKSAAAPPKGLQIKTGTHN